MKLSRRCKKMSSAEEFPKVIELSDERIAVSRPATAAKVELWPEELRWAVYRSQEPRPSSVDSLPAERRKPSSSVMNTGRQSREVMRCWESQAGVRARERQLAKAKDVNDAIPADSCVLWVAAGFACKMLEIAVNEYCSARDAAFIELKTCER